MPIAKKSPLHQDEKAVMNRSSEDYRAWPIFWLAFVRLIYFSIFERALSNYLYFVVNINESTLGIITSAGAIAYIFAPIIGQVITSKIGVRNALILSSLVTPLLTGAQMIFFEPWYLITCRVLLGLTMGLVWPNFLNLLSKWQNNSDIERSNKNFRNFNFSWNFGFIFGLLIGYIWAFTWNDYFTMVISWSLSFLLIPISFFLKKESRTQLLDGTSERQLERFTSEENLKVSSDLKSITPMIVYPILFSWLGILFLATSKSIFMFSYPVFLKTASHPSYLTYIVQAGLQLAQVIGLTWINVMKIHRRKISVLVSTSAVIMISTSIIFIGDIWYISIIIMIVGLFFGLIHGTALKIMLEYGTAKNTAKYSTINEIIIGMGFGITPIITGYVAEINIYAIFMFIVIFGFFILIFLIYLSRNIKKDKIR